MVTVAIAEIWTELIAALAAALLGWFSRHYQQPRASRREWKPARDRRGRRKHDG